MLTVNDGKGFVGPQVFTSVTDPLIVEPVLTDTLKVPVAVFPPLSCTSTPKLADPAVGEEPDNTPPPDKLSPILVSWLAFDVTVHVRPAPVPPEVVKS